MIKWLDRAGAGATLAAPLFLLHGRALADAMFVLVAAAFLLRSAAARDWAWLRRTWVRIALAWWVWLVLCSAVAGGSVGQAVAVVRFLLLAAALEHWVLRPAWVRLWLVRLLRWSAFYIALQCLLQFATGRNLFGWPRGADGELTGPYKNPRAGPPLSRLLFPAVLPLARTPQAGLVLFAGAIALMVLIGQRMPLLLTLLGLFTTALLLPRLRMPVLYAAVVAAALLAALPALSPQAAHRIEAKFTEQMANLPQSHYGLIAARSLAIVRDRPLFGAGFGGFRRLCEDPRYFEGWQGDDGGGAAICVQHPHNYYLQALVEGGIPGLLLFSCLAFAWLQTVGAGLLTRPEPLRVGLFVAALVQLWPIASSTDWVSMPLAGWFFLQLGLALAEARPYIGAHDPCIEGSTPCPKPKSR
ncbi:MAG TPA: O-antigen ligase family protein [Acetobacteraceae bacterium]|nr:O-antigen ligase family protein [Acetobacteraceae bacterium]